MSQTFELACKEAVFHFNKKHLEDPTIPMWVIKAKGESYYVNHVECNVPWSTKETPNNSHTKGSIKVKRCLLVIDDDNTAYLTPLTAEDEQRLKKPEKIVRVITSSGRALREAVKQVDRHGEIKTVGGACSTTFYMTDLFSDEAFVMLKMIMGNDLRELKPNEDYYKMYDSTGDSDIDEDEWYWEREDLYEEQKMTLRRKMLGWFT